MVNGAKTNLFIRWKVHFVCVCLCVWEKRNEQKSRENGEKKKKIKSGKRKSRSITTKLLTVKQNENKINKWKQQDKEEREKSIENEIER